MIAKLFQALRGTPRGETLDQRLAAQEKPFNRAALEALYKSQAAIGTADRLAIIAQLKASKLTLPKVEPKAYFAPAKPAVSHRSPPTPPSVEPEIERLQHANAAMAGEILGLKSELTAAQAELATAKKEIASMPEKIKAQASAQAQTILAAAGAPAVMTVITDKPGISHKNTGQLKGLARVVAATKRDMERQGHVELE